MVPGARAACQVETLELPVKMVGSRATATVRINGTPVPLTVDSGAFFSVLTEAAAAQLDLPLKRNSSLRVDGITGRMVAHVTTVDKLQLFKGVVEHVDFVVGGNEPGAGTMGLLGRNVLAFADAEYDLAHGVIRFLYPSPDCAKANMAYWAGSSPVTDVELISELRDKTPAIRAEVRLNGSKLVALFDTGATTLVSAKSARHVGVAEPLWTPSGTVFGAGRGRSDAWMVPFEKFELGNEAISHTRLRVADIDVDGADMLLGIDFFLSHRIYVSKQQGRMYFTYNGGPVFAPGKSDAASTAEGDTAAADAKATTADDFARRGAASASRHDYESALADLNRACELEPTSATLFAQRGAIQDALKHPVQARENYDKALELDPGQADARLRRVVARLAAKDRDGANADLDVLDRTLAPQSQARLSMWPLYLVLQRPAEALAQLNQWLPAHPHEVRRDAALSGRCRVRLMLGIELDQALDDCDDAVDSDPKNATYLDGRGWAYLRLGKDAKAIADFDASLEIRPANAAALFGRGLAKTRRGEVAQGDADLAAARKAQPEIEAQLARSGLTAAATPKP